MQIIQRIKYLGKNIGLENAQKGDLRLPYWLIDKYNFSVLLFLTSVSMLTSTPDSIEDKQHTGKKWSIQHIEKCNAHKMMTCHFNAVGK